MITLSRSLIVPFLQFSPRRDLRRKAFEAWVSRGAMGGETDNRAIAEEILRLRAERAALLGYESFAAYKLETEMAKTPEAVRDLLMAVWEPAKRAGRGRCRTLTAMMRADGINGDLEPWDWRYYSEKRRQAEHDLDEAALKPYLSLDAMIEAAFGCANRLFGLEFTPLDIATLPSRLPRLGGDAGRAACGGLHRGLFRPRPRNARARGARPCAVRPSVPQVQGPVVINVCNFAKGDPALLSYDDARTLFHEFGHALHHLLVGCEL